MRNLLARFRGELPLMQLDALRSGRTMPESSASSSTSPAGASTFAAAAAAAALFVGLVAAPPPTISDVIHSVDHGIAALGLWPSAEMAAAGNLVDWCVTSECFDAAFREYVRRWAFKSPQPADFIRTLADAAGSDLSWFWNGWFAGTGSLDQAVIGALERDGRLELTFWNLGDVVMPLEYRVDFADGTHEDVHLPVEIWLHRDEFRTGFPLEGRTPVRVVVDPESELPDVDREDNVLDAF